MAKVLVVTSGKGGVGKTTSTAALGAALAQAGEKVVVIDFDAGLIGSNPKAWSDRDSDRIIGMLDSKTEKTEKGERIDKHLLITRDDPARASRGDMLSIDDVLEILSTPLLGIIPESEEVLRASNLGSPVTLGYRLSAPARAYMEAAKRLQGESVAMTIPGQKRGLFDKIF